MSIFGVSMWWCLNSLWHSDVIRRQRSLSILAHVMVDSTVPLPKPLLTYLKKGWCGISKSAISQEVFKISNSKIIFQITLQTLPPHVKGCNELMFSNIYINIVYSLQWRHNGRGGVTNHQPHDCLLKRLFRHRSKKTPKLPVIVLCTGNSPVTGEFPAQWASNAENDSIWWRHHVMNEMSFNINDTEQWYLNKMAVNMQTAFSNTFSLFDLYFIEVRSFKGSKGFNGQ